DAPLVHQLNSIPSVVKYVHEPLLRSDEEARDIIVRIILPQYEIKLGRWAINRKDNGEFIGWCGLKYLIHTREIDLGYRFNPASWGHGFATESAQHVLKYGFNILQLKEIVGKAHRENNASIKVLQKIGMQYVKEMAEDDCPISVFNATNPQP
ncbi:MAG: GNAT family N-acetyltransferase, partial [Ferruginibacter sp.]